MIARIFDNDTNQYVTCKIRFRVVIDGKPRYFSTEVAAAKFANRHYHQQGVILGIEKVPAKNAVKTPA